jgi:hypothetical protein
MQVIERLATWTNTLWKSKKQSILEAM